MDQADTKESSSESRGGFHQTGGKARPLVMCVMCVCGVCCVCVVCEVHVGEMCGIYDMCVHVCVYICM